MEENIKVSIITPVYNDSKYIKETINSVLSQTYTNFELIVVDDCSSDDSLSIVDSFNDSRIVVIKNNTNHGPAYCRNLGLKKATGDYVCFLDGDDVWQKDKIEKQLQFMQSKNIDFCCTKYGTIDDNGADLKKYVYSPRIINRKKMIRCSYIGCLTVMYKRSIYPDLAIPENILKRNDYALWLKLSERTKCYYLNQLTAFYRKHKIGHVSSGKKISLLKYHKELFIKLYGFSSAKAQFYAYRNAFYYILKNIFYVKRK